MLGWKFAFNNLNLKYLENMNKNKNNLFSQEFILFPDLFLLFFLPLGYKLIELFDFTIGLFISIVVQIISIAMVTIFFVVENDIMILISLCLFNIGNSLSCLKSVQNCCRFFMKNYGLVYGVFLSGSSFGCLIFTCLGTFIIKQCDSFFINKIYLFISSSIALICGLLEMASSTKYNEGSKEKISNSRISSIDSNNISEHFDELVSDYNITREKSYSSVILYKINTKKVIFTKINLQFIYIYICDFCKYIILNYNDV